MASFGKLALENWGSRYKFHSITGILFVALVFAAIYLTGDTNKLMLEVDQEVEEEEDHQMIVPDQKSLPSCDLFSGKWVFDNTSSYPLYREKNCSFLPDDYACERFGRKEFNYQNWRWQPHDCDLPRFNGTALLEKLRGKRMVFVGDSLSKNQWASLVCLVESSISSSSLKSSQMKGNFVTFKAIEYNTSIEFYWSPLLEESNCDDPWRPNHRIQDRIVRINAIEKHARHWTDADFLIFDSFMWWVGGPTMKLLWGSLNSSDGIYKVVESHRSYEMGLKTWSDWLDIHLNRTKTRLFFVSLSPYHRMGKDWGMASNQNCYNETEPIWNETYWGSTSDSKMMRIAEAAIDELKTIRGLQVQILNITQLSEYRKDAHPSIYTRQWVPLTEEQLSNPRSYADCVHWCLPGVPDVWNQILYAYLFH